MSRSGRVVLFGWTNVGKSALFNRLVGQKLAAVADVAQTTRQAILGVRHLPQGVELALVDTPGLHHPRHEMNRRMVAAARHGVAGADVVALVVDASRAPGPGDHEAAAIARSGDAPVLVVLNKIDLVRPRAKLLPLMQGAAEQWGLQTLVPVSAATGEGLEVLLAELARLVPEGAPHYPDDYLTDQAERVLAAEWIREQLLATLRQELPHATAVVVERWSDREDGLTEIEATILVERVSQRGIVVGRGGERLKQAGIAARTLLEAELGRRVFLRLWVAVREHWRDDQRTLVDLGLPA